MRGSLRRTTVMITWIVIMVRAIWMITLAQSGKLPGLDAEVLAERQRHERAGQPDVPDPDERAAPVLLVHADAAEARHHVVRQADDRAREGAEDDAHHVDGTQAPPRQPGDVAQKIEVVELDREDHADGRSEDEPEGGRQQKPENHLAVDEVVPIGPERRPSSWLHPLSVQKRTR